MMASLAGTNRTREEIRLRADGPRHVTWTSHEGRIGSGLLLSSRSGKFALLSTGHAQMNLVTLSNRSRSCRGCGFERSFLGEILTPDISVMEHAPFVAHGDDGVLS
jgi:hypothetical protein